MLDNDELIKEPFPRELTQNPLKKIWMPYKNGHISHRRGKTQPAGQQPDREATPVPDPSVNSVHPDHTLLFIFFLDV